METTQNTFNGGMVLDTNIATTPNSVLSNALNATFTTFNGNEQILQNDMGNVKIPINSINKDEINAHLPEDFIPIGMKSYGNIIYIAAYNKKTGEGQIGSFPSPNYDINNGKLIFNYQPLHNLTIEDKENQPLSTRFFNFDLEHPVEMLIEPSYDDSVNIIITDNKNQPKLINSCFAVKANGEYNLINRYGDKNTNKIDGNSEIAFKLTTSLYRDTDNIVNVSYNGFVGSGQLKVGNYVFYVIQCDKDGNETDIIAETGVIPVFHGTDGDPFSVNGGIEDQRTDKAINLIINNLDDTCNFIKICYTRTSSANNQSAATLAYKIDKLYVCEDNVCDIIITGFENEQSISVNDLNIQYFNADIVKTQAISSNILFQGNVYEENNSTFKNDGFTSDYEKLKELSLHIYPQLVIDKRVCMDENYQYNYDNIQKTDDFNYSYYDSQFCYNYTGYHDNEIYRFGIVYIRKDNSLTSVFDIQGINNLTLNSNHLDLKKKSINFSEEKFFINSNGEFVDDFNAGYNSKGVCKIKANAKELDVIGIKFNWSAISGLDIIQFPIKGFFFVRQKRIPTLLAQAYTTNICESAFVPSINLKDKDNNNRYLFESFTSVDYQRRALPDVDNTYEETIDPLYPQTSSSNISTYRLRHNYKKRLFTLTDYELAYFDKVPTTENPASSYWVNELNQNFDSDVWFGLGDHEIFVKYENENSPTYPLYDDRYSNTPWLQENFALSTNFEVFGDNEEYITFTKTEKTNVSSDDFGDGEQIKGDHYRLRMYFFVKYKEENNINNFSLINETNWQQPDYYHELSYSDGLDFYNWALIDFVRNIKKYALLSKRYKPTDDKNSISFVLHDNRVLTFKDYARGKKIETIEYQGSKYVLFDEFDSGAGINYQSTINYAFTSKFNNYSIPSYITITNTDDKSNTDGWDLKVSTIDGKYKYIKDIREDDDVCFPIMPMEYNSYAAFCPEYELDKPYYNNIFTGQQVVVKYKSEAQHLQQAEKDSYDNRRYVFKEANNTENKTYSTYALGVDENISLSSINHEKKTISKQNYIKRPSFAYFSSKVGDSTTASFKFAGPEFLAYNIPNETEFDKIYKNKKVLKDEGYFKALEDRPFNILRGLYGPYLGLYPYQKDKNNKEVGVDDFANRIIDIYIPNYNENNMKEYFEMRFQDSSSYQAISDRIQFVFNDKNANITCYRGDCHIGWFTHRVNRNFNDNSVPFNDTILDPSSFANGIKENFSIDYRTFDLTKKPENSLKINTGDLNAIQIGSWVTFPIRSTINTSLRSIDESWTDERHNSGNPRSYYPLHSISAAGSSKMPDSECYNKGFDKSGSERYYFNQNNTIWENIYYKNRITYSNILVNGAFANGNRVFLATHYRDYTTEYGEIVKILSMASGGNSALLVICEHGMFIIPVNERALAAEGTGGMVYINTNNILPENPKIISDKYGTTWPESVIQTPYGVYGVDAYAKKIWYTDGSKVDLISDFRIQSFLNKALTMYSKQLSIGSVNIKSHYNAYKNDIMFTAYDYADDPNDNILWNICWNINSATQGNGWQTFYSWIPSSSENIGNNFISLNHEIDKKIIDGYHATNYLWKHGQSEFIPNIERIKPTYWYGKQHPFEFEFVINNNPANHKIFNNLRIISNKAEPESFHYEVIGECYDFSNDKPNMYYRQELIKAFYQICLKSNIKYNKNFLEVDPVKAVNRNSETVRTIQFPLYYQRVGQFNLIEDSYQLLTCDGYDYQNISGSEIVYDQLLNEFKVMTHVKGVNLKTQGRLRGNMHYKEDGWYVQIPSINYMQKNEYLNKIWNGDLKYSPANQIQPNYDNGLLTPLNIINNPFPEDAKISSSVSFSELNHKLGLHLTSEDFDMERWEGQRKEMRVKDKYLRIRIRYSGKDLALISGLITLYTNSFS